MVCVNTSTGNVTEVSKRFIDSILPKLRHVLIRLWEVTSRPLSVANPPKCAFWLVCHSKDFRIARLTIESIRRYSLNPIDKIYVIGNDISRPLWLEDDVTYFYEGDFDVTKDVDKYLSNAKYRGWILQQLLKLSGAYYCDRYVTIDCDTVLLKPHLFFSTGETILRLSYEHSPHYKGFERRLGINAAKFYSFTCHMMPFRSNFVKQLLQKIEALNGEPWPKAICKYASDRGMSFGEYDLYARFLLSVGKPVVYHPWLNKSVNYNELGTIDELRQKYPRRLSLSFHNPSTTPDGA